jgi:hypothetical protein
MNYELRKGKVSKETIKRGREYQKIGQKAVDKVIAENKRLGISSVFYINGKIQYLMPDGKITAKSPFKKITKKK